MKCIVVMGIILSSALVGQGQQPLDWRPNIAEDNKAATWEDTSSFIIGMLNGSSEAPQAKIGGRCSLAVVGEVSSILSKSAAPFGIHVEQATNAASGIGAVVGTISSGVKIVSVEPNSFADYIGLKPQMRLVEVNRVHLSSEADLQTFARKAKSGDDIIFVSASGDRQNQYLGGRLGAEPGASVSLPPPNGLLTIDFSHVDPLSIVVRDTSIAIGGTNGQAIANHDNQTGADKAVKGEVTLSGRDIETSKRLARAFLHAALLCGGTKSVSPF